MKSAEEIARKYGGFVEQTADDIAKKYGGSSTSNTSDTTPTNDNRSGTQVAKDLSLDFLKGIPQAITGIPGAIMGAGRAVNELATAPTKMILGQKPDTSNAQELVRGIVAPVSTVARNAGALADASGINESKVGKSVMRILNRGQEGGPMIRPTTPTADETSQAAQMGGATVGGLALGAALPKIMAKIPRTSQAALKFEEIMKVAKDAPIDTTTADQVIARAQELRSRGSAMPKVMNDYAKNRAVATPETGPQTPMTYEVGRDFASNAGAMSTREVTAMNAKMQRQVALFSKALKEANREAAASVGLGDLYDSAMKEYRQAKTLQQAGEVLKKWGGKVALGATAYKLYHDLNQK